MFKHIHQSFRQVVTEDTKPPEDFPKNPLAFRNRFSQTFPAARMLWHQRVLHNSARSLFVKRQDGPPASLDKHTKADDAWRLRRPESCYTKYTHPTTSGTSLQPHQSGNEAFQLPQRLWNLAYRDMDTLLKPPRRRKNHPDLAPLRTRRGYRTLLRPRHGRCLRHRHLSHSSTRVSTSIRG
ncbi:hypothetical protein BDW22DRAFT_1360560 [Trametopsis cervina]|nr:hypothetical protein BDW22DRAFT_1360560 [Trametopsis cervina]